MQPLHPGPWREKPRETALSGWRLEMCKFAPGQSWLLLPSGSPSGGTGCQPVLTVCYWVKSGPWSNRQSSLPHPTCSFSATFPDVPGCATLGTLWEVTRNCGYGLKSLRVEVVWELFCFVCFVCFKEQVCKCKLHLRNKSRLATERL